MLQLLVAVGTFLLVVGIIVAPYWLLVVRSETDVRQSLRKRLQSGLAAVRSKELGMLREEKRLSTIGAFEKVLSRASFLVAPIQRSLTQAGLKVTVGTIVLASTTAGLLVCAAITRITGFLVFGLVLGPIAAAGPYLVVRYLRRKRLDRFEEQFPEAIDLIARTLRAGHAFTTGLKLAAEELPDPVATEFQVLHDQQNYGLPLTSALKDFAERVVILDARFFVTAVLTQREAGGNLAEVLDNLATVIRERFRVKRQVRVATSHGRYTGVVLSLMPPVLALLLSMRAPENFQLLLHDPLGVRMIVVAVALQIIGVLLIRKISNVEY